MRGRKGQEEMVGFVLIVVLVTIIALVFFAISIRKSPAKLVSSEIESFLEAAGRYSTECYSDMERRLDIKELIVSCYNSELCLNGDSSCSVLNETIAEILKESWKIGGDRPVKAYSFMVYDSANNTIISLKEGICAGLRKGSFVNIPAYAGIIKEELEICS